MFYLLLYDKYSLILSCCSVRLDWFVFKFNYRREREFMFELRTNTILREIDSFSSITNYVQDDGRLTRFNIIERYFQLLITENLCQINVSLKCQSLDENMFTSPRSFHDVQQIRRVTFHQSTKNVHQDRNMTRFHFNRSYT